MNFNINFPDWVPIFFQNIYSRLIPIFIIIYEYSKTIILLSNKWFWNEEINKNILSIEQQFIENNKSKFLMFITNESTEKSTNIDSLFYQKQEFIEYMKIPNTELERIWKTRILMVTTPRGNIIMYYDPYKLGFTYYSDQNVISYDILNAVAMKYVMTYQCTDFFIDEFILPEEPKNPLRIHFIDEKIQKQLVVNQNKQEKYNSPFMKPKENHNQISNQQQDKLRNKFIYLGNMRNFTPCQKIQPVKRQVIKGFTSTLLDGIDSGMNWLSYKQRNTKTKEN